MSNRKQLWWGIGLALLMVVSCLVESTDARRHRSKSRHRSPKGVNIEIYHPKGVLIWYPYRPGLEAFGIEIFINKPNPGEDSSEEAPLCDICLNTTEITYGKFILRSDDAIIRSRDHLFYNAILQKAGAKASVSRSNEFYVSESRILLGSVTGEASSCNKNANSALTTATQRIGSSEVEKLRGEVKLLEDILLEVNQKCYAGQNQTKQLHLTAETPTRYEGAKELYEFAANWLNSALPTINWNRTLVDAFYVNGGIGIEVPTIIEKQKIFKLAEALPGQPISDLDLFHTEDMANEIDAWS
ncbi:uncharacterized protein LOC131209665 [Anopheles bellator]|uniref:uncharacterized protein LOC131209665 n=1 Tax=Anopheles bellator TaxID=139047 RepID=UPI00264A49B6|nr:uncharacterized protein LOC131209665 [Anopheles bellator]